MMIAYDTGWLRMMWNTQTSQQWVIEHCRSSDVPTPILEISTTKWILLDIGKWWEMYNVHLIAGGNLLTAGSELWLYPYSLSSLGEPVGATNWLSQPYESLKAYLVEQILKYPLVIRHSYGTCPFNPIYISFTY